MTQKVTNVTTVFTSWRGELAGKRRRLIGHRAAGITSRTFYSKLCFTLTLLKGSVLAPAISITSRSHVRIKGSAFAKITLLFCQNYR